MSKLTYKTSGVDIDKANQLVGRFKKIVASTNTKGVLSSLGNFSGLFKADFSSYKEPILVSSTDGVGTKLKIAFMVDKHGTVGIDLVAMSVNDVLTIGAKPLFFLDYIATGKISSGVLSNVVKGIAKGCKMADCTLIGGETAEMPDFYKKGEYDLAGFCVGVVDKKRIIDGSRIRTGDKLLGIQSSGLHSNGFSLARKIFSNKKIKQGLWKELLKPTLIYTRPIMKLRDSVDVRGIAHITGGAFFDKLPRILKGNKTIIIDKNSWPVPNVFKTMQKMAKLSDKEMHRTFNMGVGMVLALNSKDLTRAKKIIASFKFKSWVIGEIASGGKKEVILK